jgi:hypothetical protein
MRIDCREFTEENKVKVEQTFFPSSLLYIPFSTPSNYTPKNMRKIYLICIVFWRQTDGGETHDELIIVSLLSPSHSLFSVRRIFRKRISKR